MPVMSTADISWKLSIEYEFQWMIEALSSIA